jgi:hypothetical protein
MARRMARTRERVKKNISVRIQEGSHIQGIYVQKVKEEAIKRVNTYMEEGIYIYIYINIYVTLY